MSKHPLNLAIRFFLEITALVIFGVWGWHTRTDWLRFVLMLSLPLVAATLWGTFRVPSDLGEAPVAISGAVRLVLESLIFSGAALAIFDLGHGVIGWIFAGCVILHYAVSYDRILWLLKDK